MHKKAMLIAIINVVVSRISIIFLYLCGYKGNANKRQYKINKKYF